MQDVRRQTRQEKKRLAMETRKKELSRLGLRANDKEQITSQSTLLSQMGEIAEESGLVSFSTRLSGFMQGVQKKGNGSGGGEDRIIAFCYSFLPSAWKC